MKTTLETFSVALAGGFEVPGAAHGASSGVPMLFLHGYTDSWRSFEPVLTRFAPTVRAIAFTQRGHGEAGKPTAGYAPQDFAADAVDLMDRLGISCAVVVGHSMGSYVAQRLAIDHPERVSRLVLVGSFPTLKGNPVIDAFWRETVAGIDDPIDPEIALEFQRSTIARPIPEVLLRTFAGESVKTPARVWRDALAGLMQSDHSADLGRLAAPTLIIWGARDQFFPRADQELLLSAIPQARLLVYPDAGHALHWEEPERFVRDVTAFAEAGLPARSAA